MFKKGQGKQAQKATEADNIDMAPWRALPQDGNTLGGSEQEQENQEFIGGHGFWDLDKILAARQVVRRASCKQSKVSTYTDLFAHTFTRTTVDKMYKTLIAEGHEELLQKAFWWNHDVMGQCTLRDICQFMGLGAIDHGIYELIFGATPKTREVSWIKKVSADFWWHHLFKIGIQCI